MTNIESTNVCRELVTEVLYVCWIEALSLVVADFAKYHRVMYLPRQLSASSCTACNV